MDVKDSCIFRANWLEAAHTIKDATLRCYFFEAVLQYALTGMKLDTPPELTLALNIIYSLIDIDRDKYQAKCERYRENARKRYEKQQSQATACNGTQSQATATDTDTVTVNDTDTGTVTDKDNDFKNNPPIPPRGGRFNFFKDYYIRVSEVKVPKRIEDIGYENQYVWRAAEGNPGYIIEVDRMLKGNPTDDQAKMMMQTINAGYATTTEFRVLRLALEMKKLRTTDQRKAVLEELKRSEKEPDIFDTLLEKCEYINAGNKVNSLKGFMQSRRD